MYLRSGVKASPLPITRFGPLLAISIPLYVTSKIVDGKIIQIAMSGYLVDRQMVLFYMKIHVEGDIRYEIV